MNMCDCFDINSGKYSGNVQLGVTVPSETEQRQTEGLGLESVDQSRTRFGFPWAGLPPALAPSLLPP